jgi:endonuclease/exonuclease/phosphatase family metal-dependent hydrolase
MFHNQIFLGLFKVRANALALGMKTLVTLLVLLLVSSMVFAQNSWTKFMTYNIRYNNPADGLDAWDNRKAELIRFVESQNPDIIGFQEVLVEQLKEVQAGLNPTGRKYEWVGVGRDDGNVKGEFAPIFYDGNRYKKISSGHFWLAPNSEYPQLGWDAACIRICTYVVLKDLRNGETFSVFNAHLDHVGSVARAESAKLMQRKMKEIHPKGKHVLMGDFNADLTDSAFSGFRSWENSRKDFGPKEYTYSTFDPTVLGGPVIDHILFDFRVSNKQKARILRPMFKNRYLSDHFPVVWDVQF